MLALRPGPSPLADGDPFPDPIEESGDLPAVREERVLADGCRGPVAPTGKSCPEDPGSERPAPGLGPGLELVFTGLGLAMALPLLGLSAHILYGWASEPRAPAWLTAYALSAAGAGVSFLGLIPLAPGRTSELARRIRRLADAGFRVGVVAAVGNIPLALYMTIMREIGALGDGILLAAVLGCNALLASWAIGVGGPDRPGTALGGPGETRLLAMRGVLLTHMVRCPYCASDLAAPEALVCRSCETPHHQECWDDAGGCTTYACGERVGVTLSGGRRMARPGGS